ncbi:MAG: hypothetical protein AB1746_09535 [Candidatus Zixiibacteriota bacterium]
MRYFALTLFLMIFLFGSAMGYDEHKSKYSKIKDDCVTYDYHSYGSYEVDVEDGTVIITLNDRDADVVEITEDYELFINGDRIKTNDEQKKLLGKFHAKTLVLVEQSKVIGLEGAKIGAKGAGLGLKALGGVFRLLDDEYDTKDLERDLEREAAKLEADAEELELQAEEIEDMADELEEIADDLARSIPELDDLDW